MGRIFDEKHILLRVQNYGIYRNCFIKSVKLGGFFYFRMLGMGKDIIQIKDK